MHLAVALDGSSFAVGSEHGIEASCGVLVLSPQLGLVDYDVVVVAEFVALAYAAVWVAQVVGCLGGVVDGSASVFVGREFIVVVVCLATQQVGHGLIVHALGVVELESEAVLVVEVDVVVPGRVDD